MRLESERLYLRKLGRSDATEAYAGWLNDPEVNQFLEIRHSRHSVESCRDFIAAMNESETDHLFGIFQRDSSNHIGNIKVGFIDRRYQAGQVSLLIGEKKAWGQGFATESIRRITHHGFTDLGLARLEAGCYESNFGSLRAFLKVGYSVEGFMRRKAVVDGRRVGCFWLGILRDEWEHAGV